MTEHLPIQRWTEIFTRYPASEVLPNENGEYVTYADHLAALRDCEARVHEAAYQAGKAYGLTVNGYTRGLDAAREAVAALLAYDSPYGPLIRSDATLTAIDALREKR
jgi:hypothetical protein